MLRFKTIRHSILMCTLNEAVLFCRTSALGQRGHWAGPGQYPLYPQKRTLVERTGMSALCQKRTSCGAANCSLFDHLIGTSLQRLWHGQTEGFGGLEINGEFVLGGSLNRKIGRLFTSKNAIDIIRSLTKLVNPIRAIRNKATFGHYVAVSIDRRQLVPRCKLDDQFSIDRSSRGSRHDHTAIRRAGEGCDAAFNLCGVANTDRTHLHSARLRGTLDSAELANPGWIRRIPNHQRSCHVRRNLLEQFHPFSADTEFVVYEASCVAPWPGQAVNDAR